MNINPQFLFDENGAPTGVYLTMEQWNTLSGTFSSDSFDKEEATRFSRYQAGEEKSIPAQQVQKMLRDGRDKIQR